MDDRSSAEPQKRGAIWDAPLRLFHWALVALIAGAWWTGEEQKLDWHLYIGMTILILLLFRLLWGVFGGSTARFAQFFSGPSRVRAYLADPASWRGIGHNPLGSLSVFALLGVIALQVTLGLFSSDNDGLMEGPLAPLISLDTTKRLTGLHESLFNVILGLIGLHIAAILYYILRGKNLVGPMLTGQGALPDGAEPIRKARWWVAPLCLLAAWAIAGAIWTLGSTGSG